MIGKIVAVLLLTTIVVLFLVQFYLEFKTIFDKNINTKNIDLTQPHIVKLKSGKYVIRKKDKDNFLYLFQYEIGSNYGWYENPDYCQHYFLWLAKYHLKNYHYSLIENDIDESFPFVQ